MRRGGTQVTRPRELMTTLAACSASVAAATWFMTERQAEDWRLAAWCVLGVGLGVVLQWVFADRRKRRAPSPD